MCQYYQHINLTCSPKNGSVEFKSYEIWPLNNLNHEVFMLEKNILAKK
jgi:hypothetical protein